MKTTTIDWGTYSAKIFHSILDRKQLVHQTIDEVVFAQTADSNPENIWERQIDELNTYLKQYSNFDGRTILSCPHELLSFRYREIPVAQKKKVLAMLPFQLEDDIPFNIQDTYLASTLIKKKTSYDTLNYFTKKSSHTKLVELISNKHLPIQQLIHPADALCFAAEESSIFSDQQATCIIDLGHETTKAYFFLGKKIRGYQLSHFGGSRIDEMMSSVYRLPYQQLKKFKHDSSFIVPKELFSQTQLTEDQRFFAENMDMLFYSFVQEFKRWDMSFRVETKTKINQVFIIGGTSMIKNMDQYLSYYWERPVQRLANVTESFHKIKDATRLYPYFAPGDFLAQSHRYASKLTNHLGNLSYGQSGDVVPIYSLGFLAARSVFLSLLIVLLGTVYLSLLSKRENDLDKSIKITSQNSQLEFSSIEKSQMILDPSMGVKKLETKVRKMKKDLQEFSSYNSVNALAPLKNMQIAILGTKCFIESYQHQANSDGKFKISNCDVEQTKKVANTLTNLDSHIRIQQNQPSTLEGTF